MGPGQRGRKTDRCCGPAGSGCSCPWPLSSPRIWPLAVRTLTCRWPVLTWCLAASTVLFFLFSSFSQCFAVSNLNVVATRLFLLEEPIMEAKTYKEARVVTLLCSQGHWSLSLFPYPSKAAVVTKLSPEPRDCNLASFVTVFWHVSDHAWSSVILQIPFPCSCHPICAFSGSHLSVTHTISCLLLFSPPLLAAAF